MTAEKTQQQEKSIVQNALDEYRQLNEASQTRILELLVPELYPHLPEAIVMERRRDVLLRDANEARQNWALACGMGFRPKLTKEDEEQRDRWYERYQRLAADFQQLSTTLEMSAGTPIQIEDSTSNTNLDNSGNTSSAS